MHNLYNSCINTFYKIGIVLFLFCFSTSTYAQRISKATGNWNNSAGTWTGAVAATGNITVGIGDTIVTGAATSFTTELTVGDPIFTSAGNYIGIIKAITNNNNLTLVEGAAIAVAAAPYLRTDPTNANATFPNAATEDVVIRAGHVVTQNGGPYATRVLAVAGQYRTDNNNRTINVNSFLTVLAGGTLDAKRATITVTGITNVTGTLTDSDANGSNTFVGKVTVNPNASFNVNSTSACTFRGGIEHNGTTFFVKGAATFNTNTPQVISGSSNMIFNGAVTVAAGITCDNQNTGIVQMNNTLNGGNATSIWINNTNSYLRYANAKNADAPMKIGVLNATANPNTVEYSRNNAQTIKITTYHHLILSGTTNSTKNVKNTMTINGNFTYSVNGTGNSIIHNNNGQTLTVGGDMNVVSGRLVGLANGTNTNTSTITIGGSFRQTGGTFRGVSSKADLTMTVSDSFIVRGGTFDFSSGNNNGFTLVNAQGHFIHTAGTITNSRTGNNDAVNNSRIELNGSSVQHLQGGGTWTGTANIRERGRLVINNANGVQCVGTSPVNIANLQLLNGVITATSTAYPNITGSNAGAVYGTFSNTSAVEGKLQRAIIDNGTYNYPLKKGSLFQTLALSTAAAGNAGTLAYELFDANTGGTYNTFFFTGLVNNGMYWLAEASSTVAGSLQISDISPLLDVYSMASSSTLTGTYNLLGGTAAEPTLSNIPVSMSANSLYMTLASVGNLSGVIPVGNSHDVTKLTTIAAALNAMTVTGNVIFELQSDYDGTEGESFPIHFKQFKTVGGAHYAIVRPALGVTAIETSNSSVGSAAAQIVFDGVDRLTFDGAPGGVGTSREWLFWNSLNNQQVFKFINSSDTVTIKNLNIGTQNAGVSPATTAGAIRIEMVGTADGHDYITIDNCKFYPPDPTLDKRWAYGIYMYAGAGSSVSNHIYIKNCEFDNISLANGQQYAIFSNSTTRFNQIHITDNSLYQSVDETNSLGNGRRTAGLMRINARNIFVKRNYLGGTAAFCAGNPYTVIEPVTNANFLNIRFLHLNGNPADSVVVEDNVMQNIDFSSNVWNGNFEPILNGLILTGGKSRIVRNSLGDATGLTDVVIRVRNTNGVDMGAVGVKAYDLDFGTTATGIFEDNIATNIKLRHLTVSNRATLQFEGLVVGLEAKLSSISRNTFNQIETDITDPNVLMIQRGIIYKSSYDSCLIENNTIGNFINNASGVAYTKDTDTFAPECVGFRLEVPNTAASKLRISKNKFYNFESAVTGLTVAAVSIKTLPAGAGNLVLFSNNMITMGFGNNSDVAYIGVLSDQNNPSTSKVNLFYNTILVTGPGAGPTANDTNDTYCVYRKGASNATPFEIRNCIVYNNRLQGNNELHLTFATDNTTNWTSQRNLFFVGDQSTPPVPADSLARWGTTLVSTLSDWQTASGQDPAPSFVGPAYFFDPANGNLTPLGSNLCELFQSIAQPITNPPFDFDIVDDHFDVARDATSPVPGAVEFTSIGYWTGIKSTDWNDPQNWCNGIVPDSTIVVYIVDLFQPTPRWYPVIDEGTVANCRDLIITNGEGTHLGTQASCSSPFCIYPTHDSWAKDDLMPFKNLAAKLTIGVNGKLRVHGNMRFHNVPSDDSSFIHAAGTIEFVGRNTLAATQNIPAYLKYKNVMITGDNIKVMQGDVTIRDTLTINVTPALSLANNTLTCNGILMGGGDLIGSTNSNLVIGGTAGGNFGTVRFRNIGQGQSLNNYTITRSGLNASVTMGTTFKVHNKLTIAEAKLINNGLDFTLLKDMEVGNNAANVGTGTAIFRNTTAGTAYQMIGNGNFGNVQINDGNGTGDIVTLVNNPTVNNFTISNGRFNHGSNTLTVMGNWTRATANTNYDEGTGTAIFAGTGLQTITFPTQVGETFYNFTASKPSNSIRLSNGTDLDVTNQLTLTSGIITFANLVDTVKISSTGSIVGGNANSYVSGKLSYTRSSSSMENMPFPIGKSRRYRPVTLEADATTAATTRYTAEQIEAAASGLGYAIDAPIQSVSDIRYFRITQSPANTLDSGRITLSYSSDDGVVIPALLRIVKSQAGAWLNLGGQGTGVSVAPINTFDQTITSNINFTTFSDFALATEDLNPLPIELLSFTAQLSNEDGLLNWKTANETNSSHFIVERSVNGKDFAAIGTVKAVGYSRSLQSYSFIDEKVTDLNVVRVYYRLTQVDLDGKTTQSRVIVLLINATQEPYFSVYPNPFNQEILIDLAVNNAESATIQLTDVTGKLITQQLIALQNGLYQGKVTLAENIANGVYLLSVQTADRRFVQKLIKQ